MAVVMLYDSAAKRMLLSIAYLKFYFVFFVGEILFFLVLEFFLLVGVFKVAAEGGQEALNFGT